MIQIFDKIGKAKHQTGCIIVGMKTDFLAIFQLFVQKNDHVFRGVVY